jgi:hypothetical protein
MSTPADYVKGCDLATATAAPESRLPQGDQPLLANGRRNPAVCPFVAADVEEVRHHRL